MARRGSKKIDTLLKEALEANDGQAAQAIVTSAIRVAVSDGFEPDPNDPAKLIFVASNRHPDSQAARSDLLNRIFGRPTQTVEVEHRAPVPFLLDPALVALHGIEHMELEDIDEDGHFQTREIEGRAELVPDLGDGDDA